MQKGDEFKANDYHKKISSLKPAMIDPNSCTNKHYGSLDLGLDLALDKLYY